VVPVAPRRVLVGAGANLGEPSERLRWAVGELRPLLLLEAVSSLYRTEPVGRSGQPDFLNLVCAGTTSLCPEALLEGLLAIERAAGRVRTERNAPRILDLDLLGLGDLVLEAPGLTLPHPRLHERRFVLEPLVEIAPEWVHPVLGATARELLGRLQPGPRVERLGPLALPVEGP